MSIVLSDTIAKRACNPREKKKGGKKERKEKVFIGRGKEKEIDQETSERLLVRRLAGVAPAIVAANRIFQN